MQSRPDSALTILLAIDSSALNSASDRALFALLMSQALDKNYIDVTSDSLIAPAAEYFAATDDSHHDMLAQYYLGRVKFNAGAYSQSLVAMFKAYDLAKAANNHLYAGLAARGISYIYNETFNGADELKFAEVSLKEFKLHGVQPYIDYAMLDVAKSNHNHKNYTESINLTKQIVDSAKQHSDIKLHNKALRLQAISNFGASNYDIALNLLTEYSEIAKLSTKDSVYLGLCHINLSHLDKGMSIINSISEEPDGNDDWLRYKLFLAKNDINNALISHENMFNTVNYQLSNRLSQELSSNIIHHYQSEKEKEEIRARNSKFILWTVVTLSCILFLVLSMIIIRYYKTQQSIIKRNITIATNYKELISLRESMYSSAQKSVASLIKTKFETLDYLCKVYYENPVDKVVNKKLSDSVTKLIDDFSSNKQIDSLERLVNEHFSDLIKNFRSDFPKLKDADYKLFLFSVLGFSNSTISIFLHEEKITAIYDRKRRLKDKIKLLTNDRSVYYLSFLS